MFCEHCGQKIPEGATFCEYCGAPVEPDANNGYSVDTKQKSSGRPRWLLGLAAVSIAVGMFIASVAGGDDSHDKTEPTTTETAEEADEDAGSDDASSAEAQTGPEYRVYAVRGVGGGEGNDFYSFDDAIDQGALCVEQDVIMSATGTLFVTRDRGYNGAYDSVCADAGFPKLEDVFDRYGTGIVYVVEIKAEDTAAADELIRLIYDYGLEDNVIIQSFFPNILKRVKSEFPDMTSIILHDHGNMNRVSFGEALDLGYADMVAVNEAEGDMTEENCTAAQNAGKKFAVWSLDSESQIREAIEMGVDAYFTREPGLALKLEEKYGY